MSNNSQRQKLGSFGAGLLLFGAMLGSLTVFSALIPGELGVWPRFETGGMALYLSSGVCAAALAILWFEDRAAVEAALGHPLVLAAMFIALATGIFAFFVEYPWLSVFGYPLIGEGVLRYTAMGVLFATALVLRKDPLRFRILLISLLVGSVGATAALFFETPTEFVSLDIVGILVVSAFVGAWYLTPARCGIFRFLVCFVAVASVLVASSNNTAILSTIAVGLPGSLLIYLNTKRAMVSDRSARMIAAFVITAIPFAGLLAAWGIPLLTESLESVTSRKLTYQISFEALRADPMVILAGQGWGEIVMTLDRLRTVTEAILWDGSWDGAARDLPHAHSQIIETLFGGGILAVLALLAMLAIPVIVCEKRELPVAVFAVSVFGSIGAFWPQVSMTVAPVALALGLVSANQSAPKTLAHMARGGARLLPVVALVLLGCGLWLVSQGLSYQRAIADVRTNGGASDHACNLLPKSGVYGDLDLAQGFAKAYRPVFEDAQNGKLISEEEHRMIAAFLCSAEARAQESTSPSLHLGLESFRVHVSGDAGLTPGIARYGQSLAGWSDKLVLMLNAAPTRTDMTIGFLASRLNANALQSVESLSLALLNLNPNDPVANWYLGQALLRKGDPASLAAGMSALRRSLSNGIKKFFPVSEEFETLIIGAAAD